MNEIQFKDGPGQSSQNGRPPPPSELYFYTK
jgi:hypothetical protein